MMQADSSLFPLNRKVFLRNEYVLRPLKETRENRDLGIPEKRIDYNKFGFHQGAMPNGGMDYGISLAAQVNCELANKAYNPGEEFLYEGLNFTIRINQEGKLEVETHPNAFASSKGGFTLLVLPETRDGVVEHRSVLDLNLVSGKNKAQYDLSNFSGKKYHLVMVPYNARELAPALKRLESDFKQSKQNLEEGTRAVAARLLQSSDAGAQDSFNPRRAA